MANSDKNIKITPNISQTAQPNVVFTGQGNIPITLKVLDDSYGTLSFEGTAGQLFSVNNNLSTGVIFSVNDISGIPQIDVNADGTIRLAPFGTTLNVGGIGGSAFTIQPSTRASTGAGANVTIAAGSGVTTGAGGSVILQPGAQATSGGNGVVIVRQPGGTAGTDEIQMYHDGTDGYVASKDGHLILRTQNSYIKLQDSTGAASVRLYLSSTGSGTLYIDSCYQIYLSPSTSIRSDVIHIFGSGSQNFFSSSGIGLQNTAYLNFYTGAYYNTSADSGFVRGGVGQIRVTDGSTGGGSFAFTSSSPSGYAANQDNLALTGSAFQRLSGTAARDITGVAPPSGGSHVDGRMMRIYNVGSFNLTLKHNSASSTAANRFFCVQSVDIIVSANDFAELIYDSTNNGSGAAGWRVA
jgi:hypothetical protein